MNTYQYQKAVEQEIGKINQMIDQKIISGLDYRDDARRHRKLLAEARRVKSPNHFWSRTFRLVSTFLF